MTNLIPSKQLYSRWDVLPDALKEAIASETNSDIVWKAGETEHLPQEKIAIVSRLAGYTLMGFVHPEDIAKEIQDASGINPNIAASIANTLNSRIFNPLKNELEKIYAPAISETRQPKIVEEIKKPADLPVTVVPASVPPVSTPGKTVSEMDSTSSPQIKPLVAPKPMAGVPLGPKIISTDSPTPFTTGAIPTAAPTPSAPSTASTGSPQAVNVPQQPKPTAPSQEATPARGVRAPARGVGGATDRRSEMPGPVILHQESELPPIQSASGFKLEIPGQKFNETKSGLGVPPKPAQVEIGPIVEMNPPHNEIMWGMKPKLVVPQKPETPSAPRVVHYSEARTPLANEKTSQGAQAPNQPVSFSMPVEITSQSPKPTIPVPVPPKPTDFPVPFQQKKDTKSVEVRSGGTFNHLTSKIFPEGKSLPDPLKEPELPPPASLDKGGPAPK